RLRAIRRVTATSWQDDYPVENCLDPRNENGWSPQFEQEGPVHLTATFAEPLNTAETPYATVQLNFGHGRSLVAAKFEIQAMTGLDDDSPLPADVIAILDKEASKQSGDEQARLQEYYVHHAENTKRLRIDIANLEERLTV